jgi:hypothetical protein
MTGRTMAPAVQVDTMAAARDRHGHRARPRFRPHRS